jgi:hypothetical protein
MSELRSKVEELDGSDSFVYIFAGKQLRLSKGPFRYLLGNGEPVALFDVPGPENAEVEEEGYVGREEEYDDYEYVDEEGDDEEEEGYYEEDDDEEEDEVDEEITEELDDMSFEDDFPISERP